jgi:hypothetical protein
LGDGYGKILNACIQKYEFYRNICQMNPNGVVTLRQPPNNKLFDPSQTTRISPVVQRRKAEQAAIASSTLSAGPPVFNISLGNDFANLFRPAPPLAPAPAPLAPLPQPVITQKYSSLLPPSREPGIDMALSEFCTQYGLSNEILIKLTKNGYTRTRTLRFVQTDDLSAIGFMLGEVAEMKDAVERWALPLLR